ncbi:MAG: hypothetical protein IPK94_07760 [Saprospiraceae bacterium]|nr:hypothetical protein [Saprospiraceae bacterium]
MQLTLLRLSAILHIILWGVIIYNFYKNKRKNRSEALNIIRIYFFLVFFLDSFSVFADFYISNAQFINYIYIPLEYTLLVLFLDKLQYSRQFSIALYISIFVVLIYEISYSAIDHGYRNYNPIGGYLSSGGLIIISLYILSTIYKRVDFNVNLKSNSAFWFTFSILTINALDLFATFIQASNFISLSNDGYYLIGTSRNIIKAILMTGYLIGVKV